MVLTASITQGSLIDVCLTNLGGTSLDSDSFPADATVLQLRKSIRSLKPAWKRVVIYSDDGCEVMDEENLSSYTRLCCKGCKSGEETILSIVTESEEDEESDNTERKGDGKKNGTCKLKAEGKVAAAGCDATNGLMSSGAQGTDSKGESTGAAAGCKAANSPMSSHVQMWGAMSGAPTNQMPDWMLDTSMYSQMDPQTAQIMWQQMLRRQYMSSMTMQSAAAAPAKKGKSKGKGVSKSKDKCTEVEGTFSGKLKSINFREGKGYGFIECAETYEKYGRDVYIGVDAVLKGAKVGDWYEFNLILSKGGHMRATNVISK